jgi:outer membrane immunogenic protein
MYRTVLTAVSAAALCLVAAPALAQSAPLSGAYGTLGYSHVDADEAGLGTVQGRLGYKFTPFLGVEAEGALGVDTDRVVVGGVPVDAKIKRSVAAYAVGSFPIGQKLELFARGGYGETKLKVSAPGVSVVGAGESWNYGAGAQYFFDGQNGVRADYTRHDFRDNGGAADVWGVSYVRRF